MASTAHRNAEQLVEHRAPLEEVAAQVDRLAAMVRDSRHFVVFTGAGISTSAGIHDFRGPDGKWTRLAQGKEPLKGVATVQAFPTPTHMSLVELHRRGVLKYLISQNCDGLHRRSGLPASAISELHGNGNVEICEECGQQYFRDVRCDRVKGKGTDHFTGRFCRCGGRLLNSTIDFGQGLPQAPLRLAVEHSNAADVHLALGSSLTVNPACDMPARTARRGGTLVICNLQKTPLTDQAAFQIFANTDDVMRMLMERLTLPIPPFRLLRRVVLGVAETAAPSKRELYAKAVDVHDPTLEIDVIHAIDWTATGSAPQGPAQGSTTFRRPVADSNLQNVSPVLHFIGHYAEPPLKVSADLSVARAVDLKFSYDPYGCEWACLEQNYLESGDVVAPSDADAARVPDYGESHHEYCVKKVMEARKCSREDATEEVKRRVAKSIESAQRPDAATAPQAPLPGEGRGGLRPRAPAAGRGARK